MKPVEIKGQGAVVRGKTQRRGRYCPGSILWRARWLFVSCACLLAVTFSSCEKETARTTGTQDPGLPPPPPPSPGPSDKELSALFNNVTGIDSVAELGVLSVPRPWACAVAADKRVFFAGGAGLKPYNAVDILDINNGIVRTTFLSEGRYGIAGVATDRQVFFAGGLTSAEWKETTDRVDIYDLATNQFSIAQLSEPRTFCAAATAGDYVLVAGGLKYGGIDFSAVVDIYNLKTGKWSEARLSQARYGIGVYVIGSRIFFAGGIARKLDWPERSRNIDVFDTETATWSVELLPRAVDKNTAVAVGENVYLVEEGARECLVLDKNTRTWSSAPMMQEQRYFVGVGQSGEKLLIMGGSNVNWENSRLSEVFDTRSRQTVSGFMAYDVVGAAIASVGGDIYIAGGESDDKGIALSKIFRVRL